MAISLVQSAHANSASSVVTQTVSLTGVTAGHLLVLNSFTGNGAQVAEVVDNNGGLWIRGCEANAAASLDNETWYASGVASGNVTVTTTLAESPATDFTLVLTEFSSVSSINAMDQECPNGAVSGTHANTGASVQGFTSGELFMISVTESGATLTPPSGWASVATGRTYDGVAYLVGGAASVQYNPSWTLSGSEVWLTNTISFATPQVNAPVLNSTVYNMPQVQVEWSPTSAPFTPVWRNVARYVQSFKTTQGRQHQLDRIEAGSIDITFDGRDGTFNPWNQASILWNNYQGLQPMNVIRMTAAWNGITYPVAYGYVQSITPTLADSQNVDVDVKCWDILQFLSLRYLSGSTYATLVLGDSPSAYYRLGDPVDQFSVADVSGNSYQGSIINGDGGSPLFGASGVLLYDSNGALDLTNGTKIPNGGFTTTDNTTQPPTVNNALSGATAWSFECWMQYSGADLGISTSTTASVTSGSNVMINVGDTSNVQIGWIITSLYNPSSSTFLGQATVTGIDGSTIYVSDNAQTSAVVNVQFSPNCTLFTTTVGLGELDIRYGSIVQGPPSPTLFNVPYLYVNALYYELGQASPNCFDGNWHHFVLSYSSGTPSCYIDGSFVGSNGVTLTVSSGANSQIFGCNSAANNGFAGTLDECALYPSALSSTQITNHYNEGLWFRSSGETGGSNTGLGASSVGRLNHVLAVAGFPSAQYAVGLPYLTPVYGEVDPVTTTTALDYTQILMETEPGIIFQGQDGNIYALNRQYVIGHGGAFGIMNSARAAVSQGIFGDTSGATYAFEFKGFDVGQDDLDTWNDIQAQSARPGTPSPVLQEVDPETDATGISLVSADQYGQRTLQGLTSLLFLNDSDALAVAEQYLRWYASGIQRAPSITIQNSFNGGANLPQILGRTIYDRITVEYQGQTAGTQFTQDSIIESIAHDVDVSTGIWACDFAMSPYEISLTEISTGGNGAPPVGQLQSINAAPIVLGVWKFGSEGQLLL